MAKHYVSIKNSPIIYNLKGLNLTKTDLCKHLNIGGQTLNDYIEKPSTMRLETITIMAGLFGMTVERLVYLLLRNKPTLNKRDKFGKWYLESIASEDV